MYRSAFFETEFYLLVATSFVLPVAIYAYLMWRQLLSRTTILLFSSLLLALSGVDVYLLRALRALASASPSQVDDQIFASELSVALYLLPAVFAGIAINVISHTLTRHLDEAEHRFQAAQRAK